MDLKPQQATNARAMLEGYREGIRKMLPKAIGYDRFMEMAIFLISDRALQQCDQLSLFLGIAGCAKLGLEPDPNMGQAYLVPYAGKAKLIIGYKGFIELARRSGIVSGIRASVVYTNDEFDYDAGLVEKLTHRPYWMLKKDDPGEMFAAYCVAELNGAIKPQVCVMPASEILKIKKQALANKKNIADSPWTKHEPEMWKKTVIKRGSKLWPQSPQVAAAVRMDERGEMGEEQFKEVQAEIIPEAPPMPEGTRKHGKGKEEREEGKGEEGEKELDDDFTKGNFIDPKDGKLFDDKTTHC